MTGVHGGADRPLAERGRRSPYVEWRDGRRQGGGPGVAVLKSLGRVDGRGWQRPWWVAIMGDRGRVGCRLWQAVTVMDDGSDRRAVVAGRGRGKRRPLRGRVEGSSGHAASVTNDKRMAAFIVDGDYVRRRLFRAAVKVDDGSDGKAALTGRGGWRVAAVAGGKWSLLLSL